jgi:hypothetical protein
MPPWGMLAGWAAVTFCSRHSVIAMVGRGPVRGPSHMCKWCNQRYRRHGSAVSVQLALLVHGAVFLIIRRSWVRAPPAPPAVLIVVVGEPWTGLYTDVGAAMFEPSGPHLVT